MIGGGQAAAVSATRLAQRSLHHRMHAAFAPSGIQHSCGDLILHRAAALLPSLPSAITHRRVAGRPARWACPSRTSCPARRAAETPSWLLPLTAARQREVGESSAGWAKARQQAERWRRRAEAVSGAGRPARCARQLQMNGCTSGHTARGHSPAKDGGQRDWAPNPKTRAATGLGGALFCLGRTCTGL